MKPEAIKAAALAWERGRALAKAGKYREAEPHFRAALKVMPNSADLLTEYARLAERLEDWKAAANIWMAIGKVAPQREVADHVGLALLQLGRNAEALPWLEQFAARNPDGADSAVNLAVAYTRLDRDDDAIAVLQQAVTRRPQLRHAWESLITLQINAADRAGAEASLQRAVPLFPDADEIRYLLMDHRLKGREYGAGFDLFDVRWKTRFFGGSMQLPGARRWQGEPFDGTLLVRAEQGVGDELVYSSNFPDLARRQAACVVECDPRLLPLFARSLPGMTFVSRGLSDADPAKPAWDRDIMAGDLCRFFRRDSADFPAQAGWLTADAGRAATLAGDYAQRFGRALRVGLSWRSKHPAYGSAKSVQLTDLLPLLRVPGVVFFDIQYGDTQAEREALASAHSITLHREPSVDPLQDLDGLAAQLTALDLVISTSNSTVHLAGALGRPTQVLLHRDLGLPWYWAYEGNRVPWYPATELLRCPRRGDWQTVIIAAADALQRRAGAAAGL